jgi:hypothetical protein
MLLLYSTKIVYTNKLKKNIPKKGKETRSKSPRRIAWVFRKDARAEARKQPKMMMQIADSEIPEMYVCKPVCPCQ